MTKEEIEKLEAGPEMDALIAEKVMGWVIMYGNYCRVDEAGNPEDESLPIPKFSTDMAAACEVVEKQGGSVPVLYSAKIRRYSEAHTAPLAICRAALTATIGLPANNHADDGVKRRAKNLA